MPSKSRVLLAAKSILRFVDITDTDHRQRAEYIIIDTFLRFCWLLAVDVVARITIRHWVG